MESTKFKLGQRVELVSANGVDFPAGTIGTVLEVRLRDIVVLLDEDTKLIVPFSEVRTNKPGHA
jgi:small-conductance mechanosensitive channel